MERNLFKNIIKYYNKRNNGNKVNNKYGNTVNVKIINYKVNRNGKKSIFIYRLNKIV